MKKYFLVTFNTWDEMMTYRLNFMMWRMRNVLQLLTQYFLWVAIIPHGQEVFGYSQSFILTYTLGISFLSSVVLSTRTHEIADNINSGDLSMFLIRPFNYFMYWFSRDIGDKLFNISFSFFEILLIIFVLKPDVVIQTNLYLLLLTFISIMIAVFLYFLISFLLSLFGFWSPEVWAPRFVFFTIVSFISGGYFPLDILPKLLYESFQYLPFSYLLYFPIKIYLGQLDYFTIYRGLLIGTIWIGISYLTVRLVWNKGLKAYSAEGR